MKHFFVTGNFNNSYYIDITSDNHILHITYIVYLFILSNNII